MGIDQFQRLDHWEFFLTIESDILHLSRYIEFTENNFSCYSMEVAQLLLRTCSEIDIIARQVCVNLDANTDAKNINSYHNVLTDKFENLLNFPVLMRRFGLRFSPWISWKNNQPPFWWTAHNRVKHERHEYFHDATLKNVLNAAAGLFVILLYLYREEARSAKLYPNPILYEVTTDHQGGWTQDPNSGLLITHYSSLD